MNLGFNTTSHFNNEPTRITVESFISINQKNNTNYLIPIKDSKFHRIILHLTNARIYFKNDDTIIDITKTLIPIPPIYSNRTMIEFELSNNTKQYDSILIHLENRKSQVDIYQIDNDEHIVELSV